MTEQWTIDEEVRRGMAHALKGHTFWGCSTMNVSREVIDELKAYLPYREGTLEHKNYVMGTCFFSFEKEFGK